MSPSMIFTRTSSKYQQTAGVSDLVGNFDLVVLFSISPTAEVVQLSVRTLLAIVAFFRQQHSLHQTADIRSFVHFSVNFKMDLHYLQALNHQLRSLIEQRQHEVELERSRPSLNRLFSAGYMKILWYWIDLNRSVAGVASPSSWCRCSVFWTGSSWWPAAWSADSGRTS